MSISQDSGAVIVCREVFDEASHPSNEEVLDYAKRLGIDPETEPHLLDLAREGLMLPLPKGWTPCRDEATGSYYYYEASTKTTTWEHPLDSKNRSLVERARLSLGARQSSLDDDSKTTAKELESHEEATLSREPKIPYTKIPTKLAPLRKGSLELIARRRDTSSERANYRRSETPSRSENASSGQTMTDRASRDYTNVVYQDPKFYETPQLLDSPERRLREIVKRSESMSPRCEKDWEQLAGKFTTEEIDIDKMSANALTRSETRSNPAERFDKERHPKNLSQPRELTLSGGGSMFLKSNRSRDSTPCQETARLDDFQPSYISGDNVASVPGERPKSILREKAAEDAEERPTDEEQRKSVRFDLEKDPDDIKFTFTSMDDEDDGDNDDDEEDDGNTDSESVGGLMKKRESFYADLQSAETWKDEDKRSGFAWTKDSEVKRIDDSVAREASSDEDKDSPKVKFHIEEHPEDATSAKSPDNNGEKKLIGRGRFLVKNVSEKEHLSQLIRDDSNDTDHMPKNKFGNIRNIDLFSKSETDGKSSAREESGLLDEIRRSKEMMLENMKRTDQRVKLEKQREKDEVYHMVKLRHDLEAVNQDRVGSRSPKQPENRSELASYRRQLEMSLEGAKSEMEESFAQQRTKLERELVRRLEDLGKELARKEEEQIKRLVAEMDARQMENLKKVRGELEICYEKESQDLVKALKEEMAKKDEREMEKMVAEMDATQMENLKKVRNELEICYEKERQDILENLKTELDQRKRELLELRNQEMEKLQNEHEIGLAEEKMLRHAELEITKRHNDRIDDTKRELEKEFEELRNELRMQQREKITKITEDHEKCLAEILRDFRTDEVLARKVYMQRLEEIRSDYNREIEKEGKKQSERAARQETADFEKIRCEKRLLEDKYKTLKDKYSKLKNDVRLAVERRSRRKEGNLTTSETDKSTSARTRTERTDPSDQKASPTSTRSSSMGRNHQEPRVQTVPTEPPNRNNKSQADDSEQISAGFPRSSSGCQASRGECSSRSSTKFESDDATTASETVNSNMMKSKRKTFARRASSSLKQSQSNNNNAIGSDNPVENIRKQLEKLEDLGDQLPSNDTAYTLRYPFQDKAPANASSELEFFRHRIHVERDSVKRAREALRVQRSAFHSRQRAWKQKSVRSTLDQLVQEERELSDMEVSLHRTRSLLGEKVIYLRHLEQSLERVANAKRNESESMASKNDEITLSDMSSASSGFSSTDLGTDTFIDKPDHYQESAEIIASLENINSEIREIWGVLNKRQDNNIPPPPTLMYSDLGWLPFQHLTTQANNVQGFGTPNIQSNILSQLTHPPTTTTQNIIAQYGPNSGFTTSVGTVGGASSLIERTRHMRDWLRQARMESTDLISPGQATL